MDGRMDNVLYAVNCDQGRHGTLDVEDTFHALAPSHHAHEAASVNKSPEARTQSIDALAEPMRRTDMAAWTDSAGEIETITASRLNRQRIFLDIAVARVESGRSHSSSKSGATPRRRCQDGEPKDLS